MILLGIDVETTGLDPEVDEITEIGAVLYDTELKTPIKIYSELVIGEKEIPDNVIELTGITNELRNEHGIHQVNVARHVFEMIKKADYFVAHNAKFDYSFILKLLKKRLDLSETGDIAIDVICTQKDIEYPEGCRHKNLLYVSAYYGFINPFPHRAVTDVFTMLKVLDNFDINEVIEFSKMPEVEVIAHVSFAEKDKAKDAGFKWNPENKIWFKILKEKHFEAEKETYNFKYEVLK